MNKIFNIGEKKFIRKIWKTGFTITKKVITNFIKNYIIETEILEYKNNIYHRANKLYYILESGYYSRKLSEQKDTILRLYESKTQYVDFIVLHKLRDNSFVIQTEKTIKRVDA